MRFVRIVQVDTLGNYVRVVEGVARVLSRKGAKGVRRVRRVREGCAKGFDAGQGLLRVGAWWHARLLTA